MLRRCRPPMAAWAFSGPFTLGYCVCLWSASPAACCGGSPRASTARGRDLPAGAQYRLAASAPRRATIRVQVDAIRSPLTSLAEFVTLRVKDAVVDRFRAAMASRPIGEHQHARHAHPRVLTAYPQGHLVYPDLAGEALFKRGLSPARGLLRRRCARTSPPAMLARQLAGPGQMLLFDLMCGSGTILTEAAMIAACTSRPAPSARLPSEKEAAATTTKPRPNRCARRPREERSSRSPPTCGTAATAASDMPSPTTRRHSAEHRRRRRRRRRHARPRGLMETLPALTPCVSPAACC